MNLINKILDVIGVIVSSRIALCTYIVILVLSLFTLSANAATLLPKTVKQLKETSVRILNKEKKSGGSGVIYQSTPKASYILTNKHVCRLLEQGGIVLHNENELKVTHYKKFPDHDICLIRVNENLGINLKVSDSIAQESSSSVVSGHPNLLPHITSVGHISERVEIELVTGIRDCTDEDMQKTPMFCIFLGGVPIFKTLDAQLVSNLVLPGSSGSAVFNRKGELIGLVFAGAGEGFSYGYIVPQLYLMYFLHNSSAFPWVKVGTPVDDQGQSGRVFDYTKCKTIQNKSLNIFCKEINNPLIGVANRWNTL